ncbi:unnamed protein product [Arctia plantaginis]|uniref:glutathione transferase n=1 Tax=Arctia plantaginis TaxID=874455 RepID=A0A8S0ZDB0_ARCPL|nr:unnamed protein product [Arctia plantaginis]
MLPFESNSSDGVVLQLTLRNILQYIRIMSKYVYYYGSLKVIGEAPRLLLAFGGQDFEDVRITLDQWPDLKPKTPFHQVPVLEIDGKQYAQSNAICRFLGRKYGVAGDDEDEAFEIDQNVDFYMDIRNIATPIFREEDEAIKEKKYENLAKTVTPKLEKLNEVIVKNNGHLAAGKLTWGDFVFAGTFDHLKALLRMPNLEKEIPALRSIFANIRIMSKYVLYYSSAKALGEALRLLLAFGGQEFEDYRLTVEQWPEFKTKTPFNQVPVLEIDGKKYAQSVAISRLLGRKYGIAGDNEDEAFEIDQNVDFYIDIRNIGVPAFYEEDPTIKEKKYENLAKTVTPKLEKLNEVIVKNNGHLAAGKLTWGDFIFAGSFDYFKALLRMPDLEKEYPAFQQVIDNVYSNPKVKAYADAAPKSLFGF